MRSLRERPSGCVTGKPSSKITRWRMAKPLRALDPRIEMPISRGPLPCFTDTPGLSRNTSPTENDGLLSNWLRSTVVCVSPAGAWYRLARAALAARFPFCADAVVTAAAGCLVSREAEEDRALGFCTAGLARASRGASTVTGGSVELAVCAFDVEGLGESAL